MRYILEYIVVLIILVIVAKSLMAMIEPYVPYLVIGGAILLVGMHIARRQGYF